jgi:hypothetical protein
LQLKPDPLGGIAMSIQDLGAIGEFLGLFLVLATLAYLAIQTRQGKQVAASEAARGVVADYALLWSAITNDSEFSSIIRQSINDWDSQGEVDQLRSHAFLCNLTAHFVAASKAAYIEDLASFLKSWEDNLLGVLQTPGGSSWWTQCQFFFDAEVVKHLNERLAKPDTLPPSWTMVPWWRV